MHAFTVASGIIVERERIVFVQNRRRNGSLDWTTPGGVVDPGEQVIEALQREVIEETALTVHGWSSMLYSVDVDFVERELTLHAEVFRAYGFEGDLHIDDPDKVVVDGRWVSHDQANELLGQGPRWVAEPLPYALGSILGSEPPTAPARWRYEVTGSPSGSSSATLRDGPNG